VGDETDGNADGRATDAEARALDSDIRATEADADARALDSPALPSATPVESVGADIDEVMRGEERDRARVFFRSFRLMALVMSVFVPFLPGGTGLRVLAAAGLAGGVGTAAAVQAAIAGLFAPANPNPRVQRLNRAAGGPPTQLQYWFNFLVRAPAQTLNGNTAVNGLDDGSLFTNPLGNIACGVWANLLLALWALHGKGDGRYVEVEPRGPGLFGGLPATANVVANSRFSVQNWSFNNTGNLNANNYTHAIVPAVAGPLPPVGLNNQAAPITNGVAGQNNANPPEEFYNHFIVRDGANDSFYDPSYGAVALTRAQWLDASLAGLQSPGNQAGFVSVNLASPNGITTNVAAVALYDFAAAAWVP